MKRVNITGELYKPKETSIPDEVPQKVKNTKLEQGLLKTEVGTFKVNEFGEVTDRYSGSALHNIDWDEYTNKGEHTAEFIEHRFKLYFLTPPPRTLSEGEEYLVNTQKAQETFKLEGTTSEIMLEVEEVVRLNVNANDQKSLEFLSRTYDYQPTESEEYPPRDYPEQEFSYIVKRTDENTLRQKTTLSETTVKTLKQENAIHKMVEVN